jgi:hypothetical protein
MARTDNWRLVVREDSGQARVMMLDERGVALGVFPMAWTDYQSLVRRAAAVVMSDIFASLQTSLGQKIWHEARLASENSEDLAMKRLSELKFTQETWDRLSSQLAQEIVARMTKHLPEHRG